jgi:hypothetical protein
MARRYVHCSHGARAIAVDPKSNARRDVERANSGIIVAPGPEGASGASTRRGPEGPNGVFDQDKGLVAEDAVKGPRPSTPRKSCETPFDKFASQRAPS